MDLLKEKDNPGYIVLLSSRDNKGILLNQENSSEDRADGLDQPQQKIAGNRIMDWFKLMLLPEVIP